MSGYILSRKARADLRNIWKYTADNWDEQQADRYILQIHAAMMLVAKDPQKGR
jgi:toxin ParE1/3/4